MLKTFLNRGCPIRKNALTQDFKKMQLQSSNTKQTTGFLKKATMADLQRLLLTFNVRLGVSLG
jgi:hypothetical protein